MTTETPTTPVSEVLLIDLSSIAYPIWHMNQGDPNPNSTSQKVIQKVRELARDHAHVAICKDAGKSFRKDLTETYKANRPESDATLKHQIDLACRAFEAQGYPVWGVPGFEADDVIATAAMEAVKAGYVVMVVSDDKDLLQLVDPCVRQFRPTRSVIYDAAKVKEDYGIEPGQMVDYLSLVGDTADNIYGARGIGPKTAAVLLQTYNTLVGIYATLDEHPAVFKPAVAKSLAEFRPRVALVRQLVELRFDVPLEDFDRITQPRQARTAPASTFNPNALDDEDDMDTTTQELEGGDAPQPDPVTPANVTPFPKMNDGQPLQDGQPTEPPSGPIVFTPSPTAPARPVAREAELVPAKYELALDPRNLKEARVMAVDMFNSNLFSAYGSPEGVLATIALGRELGIPMMTALRQIHVIEGKQALSAQLMVALVLKSGLAEFFEPVDLSDTACTWETKRKGARNPFRITHTIEMARTAGLLKDKSGWVKNPQDMLNARASSRLARMIYPDVVGNLYTPEELEDMRGELRAEARVVGA